MRRSVSRFLALPLPALMAAVLLAQPAPEAPPPGAVPAQPKDPGTEPPPKPQAGKAELRSDVNLPELLRKIDDLLRARQDRLLEQVRRIVDQELRRAAEEQRKRAEEKKALADRAGNRVKEIGRRLREMQESVERAIAKAEEALGEKKHAGPDKPADAPGEAAPETAPKKQVPEAYQKLLQAMRLYESGEYEKAIEGFAESVKALEALKTAEARWSRAEALYRTACAHAALGRPEPAFQALEQAVHGGFKDIDKLDNDAELDALREDPRFDKLYRYARSLKG